MKVKRPGLEHRLKEECRLRHLSRKTSTATATFIDRINARYGVDWAPQIHSDVESQSIMTDDLSDIHDRFHPPECLADVVKNEKKRKRSKQSAVLTKKKKAVTGQKKKTIKFEQHHLSKHPPSFKQHVVHPEGNNYTLFEYAQAKKSSSKSTTNYRSIQTI